MKYLYLDHNVYIAALDDVEIKQKFVHLLERQWQCVYSPAHIEEIYKVAANESSRFAGRMQALMDSISEITSDNEVLPTETNLIIKREHPRKCYRRVEGIDTRGRVEEDSKEKYCVDTENFKEMLNKDKRYSSISNVLPDKIWEITNIKGTLDSISSNMNYFINKYNNSVEVQLLNALGIDKRLPENFSLEKGNYEKLKNSHTQLEYSVEILFRILNYWGYCAEKSERTTVSGTHDVSHAIYATIADALFTTDNRFAKKCQAVYSFLGVKTEVRYCKQSEISNSIERFFK